MRPLHGSARNDSATTALGRKRADTQIILDICSHKMYNSLYSPGEGRHSGVVSADSAAVGEGIGVDLRESEDFCARDCALHLSIGVRNRLS
jgi:hypothetical protein